MSNKKYSLSYQLLEKKEMQYDEFLKRIKDSIPSDTESIQNFLNNTHVSNIMSDLGKTKEEVIDDSKDLSDDSKDLSEEYTILEVFNELNESNYEFNLTIPDLISNKKISLSFPAVLSLLYIINKSTPIKMQETKKHSLKKIIYEEKTVTVTQQIINAANLSEFTSGMLKYIKQLNIPKKPKKDQGRQIIKGLFQRKKFSTILDKIVEVNVEKNKQFFTNMASDIGNLVEDTMLFDQTRNTALKPSSTAAKTSLALLMLLKTQGTVDSNIINAKSPDGKNWSISFNPSSSSGDFYNSETFNSIKNGEGIKDTDYFRDIKKILIPGSDFKKFKDAIESVKKDSALIFDDKEANITIAQVLTSKAGDSRNPAFDFIFKNEDKFALVDLKTSNISSQGVGSFPKVGGNQDNSAIDAINKLPGLNKLGNNKPMFLGMLKMIYSLYIQSGREHYFEFDSYMTSYGDVKSSCEYSLQEYKDRKERRSSEQKKEFFIHSKIDDYDKKIFNALTRKRGETDPVSKLSALNTEQLTKLRNYFEENNYTVSSLQPIDYKKHIQKINKYLNKHFDYDDTERNPVFKDNKRNKIKITGIKFKFDNLSYNDLPYIGNNPIVDAMDYLLSTDVNKLPGLDKKYKTFFSDSNKIKVIYYFLKEVYDYVFKIEQFSNDKVKIRNRDVAKKVTKSMVYNIPGKLFERFLKTVAGDLAQNVKFSLPNLKSRIQNLLRRSNARDDSGLYVKHSKSTIENDKVLENLESSIKFVEYSEDLNDEEEIFGFAVGPFYEHKEFKGKSLKEVYKDIF